MILYALFRGSFSDRRLEGIFSAKELAEAYVAHIETKDGSRPQANPDRSDFAIEEYELDQPSPPFPSAWVVDIDDDGGLHSNRGHPFFDAPGKAQVWGTDRMKPWWSSSHFATDPPIIEVDQWGWRTFRGYGQTVEHARRSAEELRRQTLALEGKVVSREVV